MPLTPAQRARAQHNAQHCTLSELRRATRRIGVELVKPKDGGYVGEHAPGDEVLTVLLVPPGVDHRHVALGEVFGDPRLVLAKAYELAQAWLADSRRISAQASAAAVFLLHSRKPEYLAPCRIGLLSVLQQRAAQIDGLTPIEVRAIDLVREMNGDTGDARLQLATYREIQRELALPDAECRKLLGELIDRGRLHDAEDDS